MLVISLDEYGKFEGEVWRRCMVAGTVFECADTGALLAEQQRIVKFLQDVCQSSDAEFPRDLHPDRLTEQEGISNEAQLQRVQETFSRELPKFLKAAQPEGRYSLYAVVSEPTGVSAFSGADVGNLLKDSFAGNRYLHMSQMALRNLIINNPVIQDQHYHLELATRVIGASSMSKAHQLLLDKQARMLGMQRVRREDGSFKEDYQLTDSNSYIAALSAAVMEDVRKDIDFNLNVQSIKYQLHESRNLIQSFMLLADMVCSVLQPALTEDGNVARRLKELADRYTGHRDNMIWCYDDVDFTLRKALNCQLSGQWFSCLQLLHDICSDSSEQAEFYRDTWVELILQQMKQDPQPQAAEEAAAQLARQLQVPNTSLAQCRYIAQTLQWLINDETAEQYNRCRYLLHSCLMTLYNHESDTQQAEEHYRLCGEYAVGVSLEEYIDLRNHFSVTLADRLDYEGALENTKKTLQLAELSDRLLAEVSQNAPAIGIRHGRTLSQLGQCLAFLGHYAEAEDAFLKALEGFRQSPADLQITRSYLLHCYLEAGQRKKYEALAKEYFGTADLPKQLENCAGMEHTNAAYATLVCLKGWYYFAPNNVYPRQVEPLLSSVLARGKQQTGHPWELVWKYTVLLAKKYKVKKQEIAGEALAQLQRLQESAQGLLRTICDDALQSCAAGKESGTLTYMNR